VPPKKKKKMVEDIVCHLPEFCGKESEAEQKAWPEGARPED
jgi:hypothetical protein